MLLAACNALTFYRYAVAMRKQVTVFVSYAAGARVSLRLQVVCRQLWRMGACVLYDIAYNSCSGI